MARHSDQSVGFIDNRSIAGHVTGRYSNLTASRECTLTAAWSWMHDNFDAKFDCDGVCFGIGTDGVAVMQRFRIDPLDERSERRALFIGHSAARACKANIHAADLITCDPSIAKTLFVKLTYSVSRAFDGGYSLFIDTDGGASGWRLRRTAQSGAYDCAEFERILEQAECEVLLAELRQLRLPVLADGNCGLDGVTFSLEIESGFTRFALRWWVSVPRQWTDIVPLLKILESLAKR